jgi:predicted nucleic acid-binding protein
VIPRSNLEVVTERSDLVLDTSVLINLLGTGIASELLHACEFRCSADQRSLRELLQHPRPEGNLKAELNALERTSLLKNVELVGDQIGEFLALTGAEPPNDIGDGEAATIVQANTLNAVAVLDDRKARRVANSQYPELTLSTTADLLAHSSVVNRLGEKRVTRAFSDARKYARMHIPQPFEHWFSKIPQDY